MLNREYDTGDYKPRMLMVTPVGVPISEKSLKILLTNTRKKCRGKFIIFAVNKNNKYYMVNEKYKTMSDMMYKVRAYTKEGYQCHYTVGKKR